jgi:hypothetical protein
MSIFAYASYKFLFSFFIIFLIIIKAKEKTPKKVKVVRHKNI